MGFWVFRLAVSRISSDVRGCGGSLCAAGLRALYSPVLRHIRLVRNWQAPSREAQRDLDQQRETARDRGRKYPAQKKAIHRELASFLLCSQTMRGEGTKEFFLQLRQEKHEKVGRIKCFLQVTVA